MLNQEKNTPCLIFARVSSKEQEDTGYSLDSQEKLLKEYAQKLNLKIEKVYRISESASGKQVRTIFIEMLSFATKNKIEVILCEKIDRLTRNPKDAGIVDDWVREDVKRSIHFVKETFILNQQTKAHDNFIWDMKVAIARFYTNNLSEEVKKGQKEKLAQGWLPTKPPLGYITIGEKGKKIHVIDPEKAPLIKKMFELYATRNYSLQKLSDIMNKKGLKTANKNKLVKSRIADLISDPFYCGKIRWNGEIYEGKQEAIISSDLFNKANDVMTRKNTPKYSKHSFVFKGLIKCFECGGIIAWEKHKGIAYGHCNHHRKCSNKEWVKEKEIQEQLNKCFKKLEIKSQAMSELLIRALKESHKNEIACRELAIGEARNIQRRATQRLDAIYIDKIDGKITQEQYDENFKRFSRDKQGSLDLMERYSDADDKYFELGINIYKLSQETEKIFQRAELEEKRSLIRLVFESLTLCKDRLIVVYSNHFRELTEILNNFKSSKMIKKGRIEENNFELLKNCEDKRKTDPFESARLIKLPGSDSNRRPTR